VALEQVFSKYFFTLLCQSFHQLLCTHHHHHRRRHQSAGAGTVGQMVAKIPSELSLPQSKKNHLYGKITEIDIFHASK
jgi:hypothetical protein